MPFFTVLSDFQPISISPEVSQELVIEYLSRLIVEAQPAASHAHGSTALASSEIKALMEKYSVSPSYIRQRELNVLPPDFSEEYPDCLPNPKEQPFGANLSERMELFSEVCYRATAKGFEGVEEPPSDLVHVSCSGYLAPSPAERWVSAQGWPTTVTHSYHMGCYGAFPALRIATGILASAYAYRQQADKRVDILHTEYLSLHLNVSDLSPNNLINATLFGDGFIKYSAWGEEHFPEGKQGLKLLASSEVILPDSQGDMTWAPGTQHFDMYLSRYVPLHIRNAIKGFIDGLCEQAGINLAEEREELYFAIHPGGPGILNHIQKELEIRDEQLDLSWEVLKEKGNMSSVTVPYIWERILNSDRFAKGQKVVSMAFGPGLTASGAVLEKC